MLRGKGIKKKEEIQTDFQPENFDMEKLSQFVIARRNDEAIRKYLQNGLLRFARNDGTL